MAYYPQFPATIRHLRVHSIVLLTLSPLALAGSFDLHVLAMPPAFNLSHDQTLQLIFRDSRGLLHGRISKKLLTKLSASLSRDSDDGRSLWCSCEHHPLEGIQRSLAFSSLRVHLKSTA